jgi:hypothetical protein
MKSHTERFNPPVHKVVLSGLTQEQLDEEWFSVVDKQGIAQAPSPEAGSAASSI